VMNYCFPIGLTAAMMATYCFKLADHFLTKFILFEVGVRISCLLSRFKGIVGSQFGYRL
jgi:hypothetical protein